MGVGKIIALVGSIASIASFFFIPGIQAAVEESVEWIWTDRPHILVVLEAAVIVVLVAGSVLQGRRRDRLEEPIRPDDRIRAADLKLLADFLRLLPPDGNCVFLLRNNNFGSAFQWDPIEALHEFVVDWNDAAHEFLDSIIEEKRRRFHEVAYEFYGDLCGQTFPTRLGNRQSVPGDWKNSGDPAMRAQFTEFMTNLNKKAALVWDAYDDLVRTARRRLHT